MEDTNESGGAATDTGPTGERPEVGQGAKPDESPRAVGAPLTDRGRSAALGIDAEVRGRPGRRTAEERRKAVLELLGGRASVDQLAKRYGVLPATIEGWRDEALGAIDEAMRRGSGKSERESQLEKENVALKDSLLEATMKVTLLQRAIASRPSPPTRSRR